MQKEETQTKFLKTIDEHFLSWCHKMKDGIILHLMELFAKYFPIIKTCDFIF